MTDHGGKSNSRRTLEDLAVKARKANELYDFHRARGVDAYLEAGRALCDAKALVKHGEWLPFLERAGIPVRRAQRQMRLADIGLKNDTVTFLGGVGATLAMSAREIAKARKLEEDIFLERRRLEEAEATHTALEERLAVMLEDIDNWSPERRERWDAFLALQAEARELTGKLRQCQAARREAESINNGYRKEAKAIRRDKNVWWKLSAETRDYINEFLAT